MWEFSDSAWDEKHIIKCECVRIVRVCEDGGWVCEESGRTVWVCEDCVRISPRMRRKVVGDDRWYNSTL